ncbi:MULTISPECIES: Zn-ribbon domain-containing OB-fold protein [unclassified Rhodococcus (in: high G+C Gram-positive bacteria)]|uniref:Zn-ribbon domain-containing OB-fold protein n=1 Tax=unclassified Rhodococcus (in: high G+C Gram-positive bacteria) TaxID=192944 RepID=UPI00163AD460|nr:MULTISPECIES: OB-fold domain-containing protein [unclassified Rhodococcus (in: high G+C Gram-positive bacteria)]MBC2639467.1 OB-fold domain-containing protein [Rhodococcus sp. 3A]MBC2895788.1 OB-fold domain-containing protein [Rhodococcus sp. 4CII]
MTDEPWGPSADGLDQPYWDGLTRGELRLQRCGTCKTWIWGPQWVCGSCHTLDPNWESVTPAGTVYSWSRSWYPFITELADRVPYVTVLVELPGAGHRRVLGILTGDDTDAVRIGDPVVGHIEHDEGATWPLLRWRRSPEGAQA